MLIFTPKSVQIKRNQEKEDRKVFNKNKESPKKTTREKRNIDYHTMKEQCVDNVAT